MSPHVTHRPKRYNSKRQYVDPLFVCPFVIHPKQPLKQKIKRIDMKINLCHLHTITLGLCCCSLFKPTHMSIFFGWGWVGGGSVFRWNFNMDETKIRQSDHMKSWHHNANWFCKLLNQFHKFYQSVFVQLQYLINSSFQRCVSYLLQDNKY